MELNRSSLRYPEIALVDLVLCGDNIGIIALATRNLPPVWKISRDYWGYWRYSS